MTLNDKGLELIKKFEGCRLKAYKDIGGIWTIGYGRTMDVYPGMSITQEQADEDLLHDIYAFEVGVASKVKPNLTSNQFSSLVCLSYNIGLGNFYKSTLLKLINNLEFNKAADEFLKWNRDGGKIIQGLTNRRTAERDLFLR